MGERREQGTGNAWMERDKEVLVESCGCALKIGGIEKDRLGWS